MTFERTSLAAPVVACTTGMKTPSTSTVTSTVAMAANDGTALRVSARTASRVKKAMCFTVAAPQSSPDDAAGDGVGVLGAGHVHSRRLEPQPRLELAGGLVLEALVIPQARVARGGIVGRVAAHLLVADDAAAGELDHAARMRSTIALSCVATTTVVPVRLIR